MNSATAFAHPSEPPRPGRVSISWRSLRDRLRGLEYGVQGLVATGLALYLSFFLEMKAPYTAAVTVWVVAGIRPGQVLAKSFYRLVGTLIGGAAGVVLIGLFDQLPWMLFTGLALWVGLCTGVANLFRNFRAYGGVLAGFTAGIVVIGAISRPDQVLLTALDRVASVSIGLLCATLVAALFGARQARAEVEQKLQQLRTDAAAYASGLSSQRADRMQVNARLVSDIVSLESMMEYAAVESPDFRRRLGEARALVGTLLSILESIRVLEAHLSRRPDALRLRELLRTVQEVLLAAIEKLQESPREAPVAAVHQSILELCTALEREIREQRGVEWEASLHFVARHLSVLSEELKATLEAPSSGDMALRPTFRPDFLAAGRHALRAFAGILGASAFWSVTQWQEGPNFLLNTVVNCAIFSTAPHPGKMGGIIMRSTALAAIGAFVCVFAVMPLAADAEGFGSLMLCLAVFLLPVSFLTVSSDFFLARAGSTFGVFFLTVMQPTNVPVFDPIRVLGNAIGMLAGTSFGTLCFLLIFPTRPGQERSRWLRTLRQDLQFCAARPESLSAYAWRSLVCQRIGHLQEAPDCTPTDLSHCLAVIVIGNHILKLRAIRAERSLAPRSEAALGDSLRALSRLMKRPAQVPVVLRSSIAVIQSDTGAPDVRMIVIAQLEDIVSQWGRHADYFDEKPLP